MFSSCWFLYICTDLFWGCLFVLLFFVVVVVQLWSVLKWRCFRSPCVSALFLLSRLVFLTSKKWIFIQQPEHQADFVKLVVEQLDTSVWHQTVSQETLRLLKILNKLQMSVWFDTSEVWIFNFSCYVIQLFWWTRGSLLADVWSSSFWLQLWLEEWVT